MKPIEITDLSQEQHDELAKLYRSTHDVRLRTRAQMVSVFGGATLDRRRDRSDCARKRA